MAKKRASLKKADQAANLGFEAKLWLAADNSDPYRRQLYCHSTDFDNDTACQA